MSTEDQTPEAEEAAVDHEALFNDFRAKLEAVGYEFSGEDGRWVVYPPYNETDY